MKRVVLFALVVVLVLSACSAVAEEWVCPNCGKTNTTKFCTSCGTRHDVWICPNCGTENADAFCGECGTARPESNAGLIGAWKYSAFGTDMYLVFRDNGEWYSANSKGGAGKGTYKAGEKQVTVRSAGGGEETYDYRVQDDQLRIYQTGMEFVRCEAPTEFVLKMDGESMVDTLQNEDLVTFEYIREDSFIERFDLVACYYPNRGDYLFIKRVVGLPGDTVEVQDGYLYVNGEKFEEPYINDEYRSGPLNRFKAYTVPEGKYFVMGDHRNNSNDSRSVGALDAEMIIGVATAVNGEAIERGENR